MKNVAGYDFCKLLTGSLGTLGVITQLALKVKPLPESSATIVADVRRPRRPPNMLLDRFVNLAAPPVAIDLLVGAAWQCGRSAIRKPKSAIAVCRPRRRHGSRSRLACRAGSNRMLRAGGGASVALLDAAEADALWNRQIEFSDRGAGRATTIRRWWSKSPCRPARSPA